jgi:hypothetical protein
VSVENRAIEFSRRALSSGRRLDSPAAAKRIGSRKMDQARCRRRRLGTVPRPDHSTRTTTTTCIHYSPTRRHMNDSNNMGPDSKGFSLPWSCRRAGKRQERVGQRQAKPQLCSTCRPTNQPMLRRACNCDSSRTQPGPRRDGGMLYPGLHERVGACPIRSERRGTERNGTVRVCVESRAGGFFLG